MFEFHDVVLLLSSQKTCKDLDGWLAVDYAVVGNHLAVAALLKTVPSSTPSPVDVHGYAATPTINTPVATPVPTSVPAVQSSGAPSVDAAAKLASAIIVGGSFFGLSDVQGDDDYDFEDTERSEQQESSLNLTSEVAGESVV